MVFLGLVRKLMSISVDSHTPGSSVAAEVFSSLRFFSFRVSLCGWVGEVYVILKSCSPQLQPVNALSYTDGVCVCVCVNRKANKCSLSCSVSCNSKDLLSFIR